MNFYKLGAMELAEGIKRGEFTSLEVVNSFIERIENRNEEVNAIVYPLFEKARMEARKCDELAEKGHFLGPLHGVPITIKESIDVKGTPSTWGIEGRVELLEEDDPAVSRLRESGAIVLAKTNAMQLLMGCETFNPIYGRTNNPWDTKRTAGGSSGGEGAAVSSMFSPLGIGTDIGGSIRTPAHFCGIHGLKPTPGVIPQRAPKNISHIRREAAEMSSVGPLARSVEDLKVAIEVLSGALSENKNVEGMRIGVWENDHILPTSPAIQRALQHATKVLSDNGATLISYEFPEIKESMQTFYGIMCADGGRGLNETIGNSSQEYPIQNLIRVQKMGKVRRKVFASLLKVMNQQTISSVIFPFVGKKTEEEYQELILKRKKYRELVLKEMKEKQLDAVLCPVFPIPALYHNGSKNLSFEGAYNSLINYLGFPSGAFTYTVVQREEEILSRNEKDFVQKAAMETEKNSAGLPVAIQIVSTPNRENDILSIMSHLEESSKQREDYPPI